MTYYLLGSYISTAGQKIHWIGWLDWMGVVEFIQPWQCVIFLGGAKSGRGQYRGGACCALVCVSLDKFVLKDGCGDWSGSGEEGG